MAKEKRLIDVDYAIDLLGCEDEDIAIKYFLAELPTVDAKEVTHGRWMRARKPVTANMECSICKKEYLLSDFNYCPNCGAKMDGERKDNG